MIANPKLIDGQSKTPQDPGDVFPSTPDHHPDPKELLRRLLGRQGSVKAVGEICEKNPKTAEWLIENIAEVDALRVRFGKAAGRFDVYADAARQALARVECRAVMARIAKGED